MKTTPIFYDQNEKLWCKPCPNCDGYVKHKHKSRVLKNKTCSHSCQMKGNQFRKGLKPSNAFTSEQVTAEKNVNWKGDQVGYDALHDWVKRNLGLPKKCEQCETTEPNIKYEWANISGEYIRDLTDWKRLCRKCHYHYDGSPLYEFQKRKIREKMSNNQSGFKNVCETKSGKFCSYISIDGKQVKLGSTFLTAEEAYDAYKSKALELYGKF